MRYRIATSMPEPSTPAAPGTPTALISQPFYRENPDQDQTSQFQDRIRAAQADRCPLSLQGGNSKQTLLGRQCTATPLDISAHRGVLSYQPQEMVITARAGTPIRELQDIARTRNQQLPFEPAELEGKASIGGCLASGLSGAARPWRGSVRDAVLGLHLINGLGEHLRFGGEVMKNVAGYDVSRLQSGAFGSLGLITDISIRVLPLAESTLYLQRSLEAPDALRQMRVLAGRARPFTGMFWYANTLHLRLESSHLALKELKDALPEFTEGDEALWQALREWQLEELCAPQGLCCMDLAPATELLPHYPPVLIDWAGARRYCRVHDDARIMDIQRSLAGHGGHAMLLGRGDDDRDVVAAPPKPMQLLQQRVKQSMDPGHIFNPGRLHAWL